VSKNAIVIAILLLASAARWSAGQASTTPPAPVIPAAAPNDSACSYRSCALSIAPRWDGLAVVRGVEGRRIANLHFFWPRDITDDLRGGDTTAVGTDSVTFHAQRAVTLRRAGAGFTDLGGLALAVAVSRAVRDGHVSHRDQAVAGAALGALVVSVPLQFAADGELSRAVWWHNVRFAR
jgi:hypothetical protein